MQPTRAAAESSGVAWVNCGVGRLLAVRCELKGLCVGRGLAIAGLVSVVRYADCMLRRARVARRLFDFIFTIITGTKT